MMAHKHLLHELLKEDQEPFQLKTYIADRCSQLRKTPPKTKLQPRKQRGLSSGNNRPIIKESSGSVATRLNLCKHACFFSFQDSPDVRKSPFFDFHSPAKSPCKSPNGAVFLHIPARTAALLLEAAMRIQKQQSKPKTQIKNVGFGLLGSFLKRIKDRNKGKKRLLGEKEAQIERKNRRESKTEEKIEMGMIVSRSWNQSTISSAGWSESNDEKSFDFGTSTSCSRSEYSEEIEFLGGNRGNTSTAFVPCEKCFCSSPSSPFRFSLQRSPSSAGRRTPDLSSPAASPSRRRKEEKGNYGEANMEKVEQEEQEKEQCSPVSVLDPPFEDDDDGNECPVEEEEENDDVYDHNYANVQRAKEQLLYRLHRFERLAELDPTELQRKLFEASDDDDDAETGEYEEHESNDEYKSPLALQQDGGVDSFVTEIFKSSSIEKSRRITKDMKRLVSDLIMEENSETTNFSGNKEVVLGRVCNRLDSWREVEFDTIDMMIELDFKRVGWTKFPEQVEGTVEELELAISEYLVDELSEELIYFAGCHQDHQLS